MQYNIVAFGATNSRRSINRQLAAYAAGRVENADVDLLDLNDFEMPIYGIDREREEGIPALAHAFKARLNAADGIVISFAEHNGSYAVAFKNIYDWVSRIDRNVWNHVPLLLMATAPGPRGGRTVLELATRRFERINDNTVVSFSLPAFAQNFNPEGGITDPALAQVFEECLSTFTAALTKSVNAE